MTTPKKTPAQEGKAPAQDEQAPDVVPQVDADDAEQPTDVAKTPSEEPVGEPDERTRGTSNRYPDPNHPPRSP